MARGSAQTVEVEGQVFRRGRRRLASAPAPRSQQRLLAEIVADELTERGHALARQVEQAADNICVVSLAASGLWKVGRRGPSKRKTTLGKQEAVALALKEVQAAASSWNRYGVIRIVENSSEQDILVWADRLERPERVRVQLKPVKSGKDLRFLAADSRQLGRAVCPPELAAAIRAGRQLQAQLKFAAGDGTLVFRVWG